MSEVPELVFAEEHGVPREVLREIRQEMEKGVHWERRQEGIVLTGAGIAFVKAKLAPETPPPADTGVDTPRAKNATPAVTWVRLRRFFPVNALIMEGDVISAPKMPPAKDAAVVRIRTANARMFARGMELPCLVSRRPGLVRYAGPMPRTRGKLHMRQLEQYLTRLGVAI